MAMRKIYFFAVYILASLISISHPPPAKPDTSPTATNSVKKGVIDSGEILALNNTMRSMVDLFVKPVGNKQRRAKALYELMFATDKFGLRYDGSNTKTAIETIESGSGDCVSLANAFVAMGRYADLDVNYLDVKVSNSWQRQSNLYYKLKHISASVRVSHKEYLGIEYRWMGSISTAKPRIMTDEAAFGSFYSNKGIELLMENDLNSALVYLLRATEIDPDNSNNWSNLGVVYRRLEQLDKAEQAYLRAIRIDKFDLTALNNLSVLYQKLGDLKRAKKYEKKLERYRRKNPYYLIELSNQEIENQNYPKALKLAKKAIKIHGEEHEFYFVAAKIYALLGNKKKSQANLEYAHKYAEEAREIDLYSRKLELLEKLKKTK